MLRSNSIKVWGIHVVSPEEEKERMQWEGFAEKECFKPGMDVSSILLWSNGTDTLWMGRLSHRRHTSVTLRARSQLNYTQRQCPDRDTDAQTEHETS